MTFAGRNSVVCRGVSITRIECPGGTYTSSDEPAQRTRTPVPPTGRIDETEDAEDAGEAGEAGEAGDDTIQVLMLNPLIDVS